MSDAEAKVAAPAKDSRAVLHRLRHVRDHLQGVLRDDEVERAFPHRKPGALADEVETRSVCVTGMLDEADRGVERCYVVPPLNEVASDPAFTEADLESAPARSRKDRVEEGFSVVPVRVEARGPRPSQPVLHLRIPLTRHDRERRRQQRAGIGNLSPDRGEWSDDVLTTAVARQSHDSMMRSLIAGETFGDIQVERSHR